MSKFMEVYEGQPVQEGIANWLLNSILDIADNEDPGATRIKLKDLLQNSKYKESIKKQCADICKQHSNLDHNFSLSRSDNNWVEYKQRRSLIEWEGYVLRICADDSKAITEIDLVLLEKDHETDYDNHSHGYHYFKLKLTQKDLDRSKFMDSLLTKVVNLFKTELNKMGEFKSWIEISTQYTHSDDMWYNIGEVDIARSANTEQEDYSDEDIKYLHNGLRKLNTALSTALKSSKINGIFLFEELGQVKDTNDVGVIIFKYKGKL